MNRLNWKTFNVNVIFPFAALCGVNKQRGGMIAQAMPEADEFSM